jgi:hypothetical protein
MPNTQGQKHHCDAKAFSKWERKLKAAAEIREREVQARERRVEEQSRHSETMARLGVVPGPMPVGLAEGIFRAFSSAGSACLQNSNTEGQQRLRDAKAFKRRGRKLTAAAEIRERKLQARERRVEEQSQHAETMARLGFDPGPMPDWVRKSLFKA